MPAESSAEGLRRAKHPPAPEGEHGRRHSADLRLLDPALPRDDRQLHQAPDHANDLRRPDAGRFGYELLFVAFIIFFCYFYTAVTFNPVDVADNMKKYGGFVPGSVRKKTAEYIDKILTRITLGGRSTCPSSAFCQHPHRPLQRPLLLRRDRLLIVVGVAMDTVQQIESHLITRHYEGSSRKADEGEEGIIR